MGLQKEIIERISMNNKQSIENALREINNDLMYNLMSASKELFHSNYHAWIFRRSPDIKKRFFKQFGIVANTTSDDVIREAKKIDLLMSEPGFADIAIENKIYADLQIGQLETYTTALNDAKTPWSGYVLSLLKPDFNKFTSAVSSKWKWLSYDDFIMFLESNKSSLGLTPFETDYLDNYIKMVKKLSSVMSLLVPEQHEKLELLQLDFNKTFLGNINKMRMRAIGNYLTHEVRNLGKHEVFEKMYFGSGITRNKIFLECEFPLSDKNFLGWQFQEGQFRLYGRIQNLHGKGRHQERVKYAHNNYSSWFDFKDVSEHLPTPLVIMPKDPTIMGQFDPDFIYRYVKISDLSLNSLLQMSLHLGKRKIVKDLK